MLSGEQIQGVSALLMQDGHDAFLDGRLEAAENLYMMALSGLKATDGLEEVELYSLLGELHAQRGRHAAAEDWYIKALEILDLHYPQRALDLAIVSKALSEVCRAQSKVHQAGSLSKRADAILGNVCATLEKLYVGVCANDTPDNRNQPRALQIDAVDAFLSICVALAAIGVFLQVVH